MMRVSAKTKADVITLEELQSGERSRNLGRSVSCWQLLYELLASLIASVLGSVTGSKR